MTAPDVDDDPEYVADTKEDDALKEDLPEPAASSPPDEGDAGPSGVVHS